MTQVKALWIAHGIGGCVDPVVGLDVLENRATGVFCLKKNVWYLVGIDIARLVENFSTFCETHSFIFFFSRKRDIIYELMQIYFCCLVSVFGSVTTHFQPSIVTCRITEELHLPGIIGTANHPDM
jgi:hypothetical protein